MKKTTRPRQTYTIAARDEPGNPLMDVEGVGWTDLSSLIAAWTKQFEKGVDAGGGLRWDKGGHIIIVPHFED